MMLSSGAKKRQGRAALSLGISSLVEGSLKLPALSSASENPAWASEIDFYGRRRSRRGPIYPPMSAVTRELQRRLRDEKSIPGFEPCLPKPAKVPSLAAGAARSNGARRR